jgi:hypothetical protein
VVDDDEFDIDGDWPTEVPPPTVQAAPVVKPPPPARSPALRLDSTSAFPMAPRSQQRTLTDEVELEDARMRSLTLPSEPPPAKSLSQGAINRAHLLSLADGASEVVGGGALDLIAQSDRSTPMVEAPGAPSTRPKGEYDPMREMQERFSLGDYSGALIIAEGLLEEQPGHAEAARFADSCRSVLEQMYTARLGPLDRVPFVAVPREQLRWLSLDHRAGFVLSHVDGLSSLEEIVDVSGMASLDTLRILFELVQQRVISFR